VQLFDGATFGVAGVETGVDVQSRVQSGMDLGYASLRRRAGPRGAAQLKTRRCSIGPKMTTSDRVFSRLVLGTIAPVVLMLTGWWGTLGVLCDHPAIGPAALGGFALGVALDLTALRRRLDSLFDLGLVALSALALFYSVMIYGFFMGLPVFNLIVGFAGGHVIGRRAALLCLPAEQTTQESRFLAAIATSILAVLCVATAWMALNEATLDSEMQHMLGLPFEVTMPMIYATIVVGGAGLLAAQYGVTVLAARRANRITLSERG